MDLMLFYLLNTKLTLTTWPTGRFGDSFKQLKIREDIIRVEKKLFEKFTPIADRTTFGGLKLN